MNSRTRKAICYHVMHVTMGGKHCQKRKQLYPQRDLIYMWQVIVNQ